MEITLLMASMWDLFLWCLSTLTTYMYAASPLDNVSQLPINASLVINTTAAHHVTSDMFLSVGMAPHLIRHHFKTFNFSSPRVITLAQGLTPAYMRFSGTDADRMVYVGDFRKHPGATVIPFPIAGFNMTTEDWDKINRFAEKVGWRMVYGVNAQIRHALSANNTQWYPGNAQQVLLRTIRNNYAPITDFEFGNEPDLWYPSNRFTHVTPEQLASDFCHFKSFLGNFTKSPFVNSLTIGPDVTQTGLGFFRRFLDNSAGCINAASWHHYYGRGEGLFHPDNYTDPAILDRYVESVHDFNDAIWRSKQRGIRVWQGETASTVSPPNSSIGESYVATFMLLDKLGVSASSGIDVVVKQAFFGFWFSLINEHFSPTPNYWLANIYKRLVGREVLDVKVDTIAASNAPAKLRAYAHCVSPRSGYAHGNVVIYVMNLHNTSVSINFKSNSQSGAVHQFLLSPWQQNITSASIMLNGNRMTLVDDQTLPPLKPVLIPLGAKALLPSKTLAFYVLTNKNATACKSRPY